MERILLLGEDHTELGDVATEVVGPVAAALTRGRHPKAYPYTHPNEDTVVAAVTTDLVLMAVADGHHGTQASHVAARAIHDTAPRLAGLAPTEVVTEAVAAAAAALSTGRLLGPSPSATTLTVVATGAGEGAALGWGDSAAALFHGRRGHSLLDQEPIFVAVGETVPQLGEPARFRVRPGDVVMVASDGLTDFLLAPWTETLTRLLRSLSIPAEIVQAAAETAGEGGGGDNLAVAALCVSS